MKISNTDEIEIKHFNFCTYYLKENIDKTILDIPVCESRELVRNVFCESNFKKLICSNPPNIDLADHISQVISDVDGEFVYLTPKGKKKTDKHGSLKDVIEQMFLDAYGLFTNKDDLTNYSCDIYKEYKWNSYEYVKKIGLLVCPYCNSEFIFTQLEEKEDSKKIGNIVIPRITIRPHLDHFISKDKKPLLAISIFNLVPCCQTCNVSIKHNIELNNQLFMNPLNENAYSKVTFSNIRSIDSDHYSNMTGKSTNFELNLKKRNEGIIDSDFERACNTIEFFRIIERYEPYKSYIQYVISREIMYSKFYSESLENAYPNLFSDGEIDRINVSKDIKYTDFIFSKIVDDLLNE
ncbi:hypothetical protein D8N35_06035 [Enterococcus casseliflavus]|uniref:hypothetical protein n=1 Tax=Enterococcus casseliflavus TaxID=37734 RepID=UPI000EB2B338|nr:hypothetical protein [Enterococcus casseliflavus]AYJ44657.1 hypothetical protein D8N35_06035 [Enterococcus casseliflavus]